MASVASIAVALSVLAAPTAVAVPWAGWLFAVAVHPAVAAVARAVHAGPFRFAGARFQNPFVVQSLFTRGHIASSAGPFWCTLAHG